MSIFDSPEFNDRLFFPKRAVPSPPADAEECLVDVGDGIQVFGRMYQTSSARTAILLFHGNGELASDYDDIAESFNNINVNLAVFGYRGYGLGTGIPTLRYAINDSHAILSHILSSKLTHPGLPLIVMGRSLGSGPAIELGATASGLAGLIIENGYADIHRLAERRGYSMGTLSTDDASVFSNRDKIKGVRLPLLVMHGQEDDLIQCDEARMNFEAAGSTSKKLAVFDGLGHNNVIRSSRYFSTISAFLDDLPAHTNSYT